MRNLFILALLRNFPWLRASRHVGSQGLAVFSLRSILRTPLILYSSVYSDPDPDQILFVSGVRMKNETFGGQYISVASATCNLQSYHTSGRLDSPVNHKCFVLCFPFPHPSCLLFSSLSAQSMASENPYIPLGPPRFDVEYL